MRKIFSLSVALLFITVSFAQKTEIHASLNGNLFSFAGKSAEANSYIIFNSQGQVAYTNNPYGSKNGVGYGLSGSIQRITKKHFIGGIELGYERAASRLNISGTGTYQYNGKTLLKYDFLNLFPYIGYRFTTGKVDIDLTGGFDIANCLKAREDGEATASNGTKYATSVDRKTIKTDIRPRIQLTASYKKVGVYVGYSYGFGNYREGYVGGVNECYARILRSGITYRLTK
jgi:hypothetical protein